MKCNNLRSHITDSHFYRHGFTTEEARRIFCDMRRLQRWLDVELAMAAAQAELGIIPVAAAEELARTARLDLLDVGTIEQDIAVTGHSLIPLLNAWQKTVSPVAAQFIHYGATTQDIQDTAQVLEIRDLLDLADRDMLLIGRRLMELIEEYGETRTIGRTHGQPALPTTFGLKAAGWLDELLRNGERLHDMRERVLVSQLFGGVGTMAALGPKGPALLASFSRRLGLSPPLCAWHASRDRFVELLSVLTLTAGGLAKIANEISQLARFEIGELEEPFHPGKIGSTTMPHKRNPEVCEQVVVLSRLIKGQAALSFDSLLSEHERDYRAVRLEWVTITDSLLYFAGLLHLMKYILDNLIIHRKRMETNADRAGELLATEALMFSLGRSMGKNRAHTLLYDLSMAASSQGRPLLDLLAEDPEIRRHFSLAELHDMVEPGRHLGEAKTLTAKILREAGSRLGRYFGNCGSPLSCALADEAGQCLLPLESD